MQADEASCRKYVVSCGGTESTGSTLTSTGRSGAGVGSGSHCEFGEQRRKRQ